MTSYHDSGRRVTPKIVKLRKKRSNVLAEKIFFAALLRLWMSILKVNVFYINGDDVRRRRNQSGKVVFVVHLVIT